MSGVSRGQPQHGQTSFGHPQTQHSQLSHGHTNVGHASHGNHQGYAQHAPQSYGPPPSTRLPAVQEQLSSRRIQNAHDARVAPSQTRVATQQAPASGPHSRVASSFPSSYDNDWDVPAFQRKQQ